MKLTLAALVGAFTTTLATSFPPSPESISSDVQILLHNDLYGNETSRQDAVIVIETAGTHRHAVKACAGLSETLWTPPVNIKTADFLDYLSYQTKHDRGSTHRREISIRPRERRYYVAVSDTHGACKSIDPSSGKLHPVACNTKLPALCTQSAPLSYVNITDTSTRHQTRVSSGKAVYTGWRDKLSFRFLGIKYGSYPQRFTDSSPTVPVGEIDALDFGARCTSRGSRTGPVQGAEDCLFLNIYTPFVPRSHRSKAKLRPVMFWIHGGAFVGGAGSDPTFDGGNLASRGDVVVVTINYRLGTFGFFVGPEGSGLHGNYALSDVVSALRWVKDNIAAFGGDPSRITIFGQSAGAAAVRAMLMSPKASGLFSAAIMESIPTPSTYNVYLTLEQEIEAQTNTILNATACNNGTADSQVACLRALGTEDLARANGLANNVVIDGKYITQPYIYWNGTGTMNSVPVMLGSMRDDGASDLNWLETDNLTLSLANNSLPITPATNLSAVFPIPPQKGNILSVWNVTGTVSTETSFACLNYAFAKAIATTHLLPSVHHFEFNRSHQIPTYPTTPQNFDLCNAPKTPTHPNGDPEGEYFKCHSGDLTQVFGTWRRLGLPERDPNDTPFTQSVTDYWTSFARTHNPNPDPAYLKTRGYVNTTAQIAASGRWEAVGAVEPNMRYLQWPSRQQPLGRDAQCEALGLGVDHFLS